LVVCLAAGAFGANGVSRRSLSAIFRNIKLVVNGETVATSQEPFIVEGSTYVPLRLVSQALGAVVNWDSASNVITINGASGSEIAKLKAKLEQAEKENAELRAQIELLQGSTGTPAETVKGLLGLRDRLFGEYQKIRDVKIKDIRLLGDENNITVNIDVDLGTYDDEWEVLTDSKIKIWLSDMCLDIQDYYSSSTSIAGKIKDTKSKDTLIEFSKYKTDSLKVSYKDKDYRHGKGLDIYDVKANLEGEGFNVAGMRFTLKSVNYALQKDEIEITLQGRGRYSTDWEAADSAEVKAAVKDICRLVAESYIEDATKNPRTIRVRVQDDIQNSLDFFVYEVSADTLR